MEATNRYGKPDHHVRLKAVRELLKLFPPSLIAEVSASEHSGMTAEDAARFMSSLGGSHIERIRALLTRGSEPPDMSDVVPWREEDE